MDLNLLLNPRTFAIISSSALPASVDEISQRTGIPGTTVYFYLKSLSREGVVDQLRLKGERPVFWKSRVKDIHLNGGKVSLTYFDGQQKDLKLTEW